MECSLINCNGNSSHASCVSTCCFAGETREMDSGTLKYTVFLCMWFSDHQVHPINAKSRDIIISSSLQT